MPLKSSQCFQSTRDVISHKMRHSSALGGGTGDTSRDYKGLLGPVDSGLSARPSEKG